MTCRTCDELPEKSVAVHVTVVFPRANSGGTGVIHQRVGVADVLDAVERQRHRRPITVGLLHNDVGGWSMAEYGVDHRDPLHRNGLAV